MPDRKTILAEFRSNSLLCKQLYDRTMEPICEQYQITRMELDILLFLANNPGYDTAKDIVEQKHFTKSHVSSSISLLEEKGYLERSFHPGNRKTVHLTPLPASSEIIRAGQAAQAKIFTKAFGSLTPEETAALEQIFRKVSAAIREEFES